MCVQGQKRGLPSACGRTRSHPVTTRADRLTFPPSDDFHNRLTSISLILKTRLEGSRKSTVPRRGGGPACVTWPGHLVSPLEAGPWWGGGGVGGIEMYVYQKEEQLLNIHSCVRHAFFFA